MAPVGKEIKHKVLVNKTDDSEKILYWNTI